MGVSAFALSSAGFGEENVQEKSESIKKIILTIDDGPLNSMGDILETLGTENPVIFYEIGECMNSSRGMDLTKKAIFNGHAIGNHSYSHPDFTKISFSSAVRQIERTEELINQAYEEVGVKQKQKFFRFPGGAESSRVKDELVDRGYIIQGWDTDTNDWRYYSRKKPLSGDRIMSYCASAKDGDIVLTHDRPFSLRKVIPYFLDKDRFKLVLP